MPARSSGSAYRIISAGLAFGVVLVDVEVGGGQRGLPGQSRDLLALGRAHAEEAVENAGPAARATAEDASKLRPEKSSALEAASSGKLKDKKGKTAELDPALPLLAELRRAVEAQADAQAIAAVKKLGELGTPAAAEVLLGELATGMPPAVAQAALDSFASRKLVGSPDAFPVLALYARHRNPELRKQALAALAALPTAPAAGTTAAEPGAGAADRTAQTGDLLIAALSDASADVRAVAAQALGARHEVRAEPQLIKLLLRKDAAAPAALGQIGGPDTARALAEMIGSVPDRMILETLGHLLKRPDFGPEPVRVQVVKTVGKMPGSQTLDILGDYVKETAKDKQRPSRIEAQKIIEQRTAK